MSRKLATGGARPAITRFSGPLAELMADTVPTMADTVGLSAPSCTTSATIGKLLNNLEELAARTKTPLPSKIRAVPRTTDLEGTSFRLNTVVELVRGVTDESVTSCWSIESSTSMTQRFIGSEADTTTDWEKVRVRVWESVLK